MRQSFSLGLLLTVAVGVLLTLGLIGFDQQTRQGLEREALIQQSARAQELASELGTALHGSEQLANTLASLAGPLQDRSAVEDLLRRMLASAPKDSVYGLGVWFAPGQFTPGQVYMGPYIHRAPGGSGATLTYEWSTPAYDYPRHSWYRETLRNPGHVVVSEPYFDVDHAYESLTRAFFDDQGRLRGVVSVDLLLDQVRELIGQANHSPAETLYITSGSGALVAHPQEKQLLAWAREHGRPGKCLCELTLEDLRSWEHARGLDRGRSLIEADVPHAGWKVFASTDQGVLFQAVRRHQWLITALGLVLWAGLGASGVAMSRSERARSLMRTLAERQRQERERQRLHAQVRQRSAELQAIIESMVDAVIVTDAWGDITLANKAALALFGESSFEGRQVDCAYRNRHPQGLDGQPLPLDTLPLRRALRGERVEDTDLVLTLPLRDQQLVVRMNAAPIRDEAGRVIAAVSVARDITQAIELERLQGDFVKMAAHELKTPLTVMKSFAQLARRPDTPLPALRRMLEGVCRGVDRMDRVVRTLLDASQLHLGQLHFEREEVELRELVEATALRTAANHPRNPIHVQPGPEVRVLGDRARLEQVLAELMDNAARYSPEDRPVEVALTLDADEVEISIHDEGIGIPAERRARLFERFYRAHAGTPYDRGGMGLGLYLSRGIVLHHGGHMELKTHEGLGTHVRFRLPRLPERQPLAGRSPDGTPGRPPLEAHEGGLQP